jgi:superfamily II DNA or RNA helicase
MLAPGVPAQGQLVEVRQRRFVVTEVHRSSLQLDLYNDIRDQTTQHLVQLSSVEDDGLGEELQVVWEIEPGARVLERATLPDPTKGFDEAYRLDAFLDAVRWGAVASADVQHLNAPFRSGIDIEDYQLDPVVRALSMPRVSLLIADDVGLGKTIEAGLVVQELMLRHRTRSVLVVCPAGLQIQWRDQMRDKFGLDFRIVDSELMKDLRRRRGLHVNPWTHFPRLITSVDFLKRERPMRLLRDALPAPGQAAYPRKFDLLIVDEAHNVAPSGRGEIALDSLRTQTVRTLSPHFEHKLFLTATPHNGYTESFAALLELLDDQRFHRGIAPDPLQLEAVMVRRLKSELPPDDLGRPRFPKRELLALEVPYTAPEKRAHEALREYTKLRQASAADGAEKFATEFVLKLLKKRLFSCPEAFLLTLQKHASTVGGRAAKDRVPQRKAPLGLLRRELATAEEDADDDARYEESISDAVGVSSRVVQPLNDAEKALLKELEDWALKASGRADSKAAKLLGWLEAQLRPDGKWTNERVIIFTEYRATQNWLQQQLASAGFTKGGRLETLYGGMPTEDREKVKAAFQASPTVSSVRILLATDAASEGIDLQNHCSKLIHYEIPWNPNRMEQRNGRVDRHGQRATQVNVYHFVAEGYEQHTKTGQDVAPGDLGADLEYLMRAALKVNQIRDDIGSVGDVIAEQIEEAMLGKRATAVQADIRSTRAEHTRKALRLERDLRAQLEKLLSNLNESRQELRLSPDNLRHVVQVGLEMAGQPPLDPISVERAGEPSITAYRIPALAGTWAICTEGLAHPHTQEVRPIVFDHSQARGHDDVVLAHLEHRLVQMCLRLLRAEVWAPDAARKLHRVSARVATDGDLRHPVLLLHARLVVLGGDNVRLHEEVISAGLSVEQGALVRLNVGQTRDASDAARASSKDAPQAVRDQLAKLWPDHEKAALAALEARQKDRLRSLEKALAQRAESEVTRLSTVLEELRKQILSELEREPAVQLDLWKTEEREQLASNRSALADRARTLPAELERETKAIRARYADPRSRLFPVAVTYVVPPRLVGVVN